ncbi:unnamed protein product [Pleuronectes platessa]|uniref:Uncharacterized protein n=1 Tax=Pleuronectes platessa TaxID=8262 RepID=A0A9N7TJ52_PLEPL|nr:unnamed protein product [Pleuronectes platessa]
MRWRCSPKPLSDAQRDELRDGWTRVCILVVQGGPLLHKGIPRDVGRPGHHVIPVLQSLLWGQDGREGQAYPLSSPSC